MSSNHGRYFLIRKNFFSWLLPWAVGLLSFIAMMASSAAFGLSAFFSGWGDRLDREVTVVLPAEGESEGLFDALSAVQRDEAAARAVALLKAAPGVGSVREQTSEELASLLEPWFGDGKTAGVNLQDLALPRVIEVTKTSGEAQLDLDRIRTGLEAVWPGADIEDHSVWKTGLSLFLTSIEGVSIVIVASLLTASCIIVALATAGALAVHHDIARLMHLVGASDHFIAGEFRHLALASSIKGAVGAEVAALVLLFAFRVGAEQFGVAVGDVPVPVWQWSTVAALPFAMVIISVVAAHVTVKKNLKSMF